MAKQPEINESLLEFFSVEDGKIKADQDAINKHLETVSDMSLKDIKNVQKLISETSVDLTGVIGKVAVDHMAANKDVVAIESEFGLGRQTTKVTVKKQHEQRPMATDPNGKSKTVYGHITARTTSGVSKGAVRSMRKVVSEYGETRLK